MIRLYRCPPLSAWITPQQCERNAELARHAAASGPGSVLRLRGMHVVCTCPSCPGIQRLRAGRRELPEAVSRGIERRLPARRMPPRLDVPPGLITATQLERLTGLCRATIFERLRVAEVKPSIRASGRMGRPACYPREPAIAACTETTAG